MCPIVVIYSFTVSRQHFAEFDTFKLQVDRRNGKKTLFVNVPNKFITRKSMLQISYAVNMNAHIHSLTLYLLLTL